MTSAERHAARQLKGVKPGPFRDAAFVLLAESGCTIRKWNPGFYGRAHDTGTWDISVPKPETPRSFQVFAHEVAHQVLHRGNTAPRWQEEIEAEDWSIEQFTRFGLTVTDAVEANIEKHIRNALRKALKRGMHPSVPYGVPSTRAWARYIDVYELADELVAC